MSDRASLFWLLQQAGLPAHKLDRLPRFLVISPPKTGSTWLADNLRLHPGICLERVTYFSYASRWLGLEWYLDRFAGSEGRLIGEATPTYAMLPLERIQLIHRLMPDVKLIYLLRDPVRRAWSHVRHSFNHGESAFAHNRLRPEAVTDQHWCDAAVHPWVYFSGDYAGQLRRWLSVFPREQIHVGFLDDVEQRPETVLAELFAFLGVEQDIPFDRFRAHERSNVGPERPASPAVENCLRRLELGRTLDLVNLLRDRLHLTPPPAWSTWFEPTEPGPTPATPRGELTLEQTQHRERCACGRYDGYDLYCDEGLFYATRPPLDPAHARLYVEEDRHRLAAEGFFFEGEGVAGVKARIDAYRRECESRSEKEAWRRLDLLESRFNHLESVVRHLSQPISARMKRWLRKAVGAKA